MQRKYRTVIQSSLHYHLDAVQRKMGPVRSATLKRVDQKAGPDQATQWSFRRDIIRERKIAQSIPERMDKQRDHRYSFLPRSYECTQNGCESKSIGRVCRNRRFCTRSPMER